MVRYASQIGQHGVPGDGFVQHQAITLAVFGHVGNFVVNGFLHTTSVYQLAVHQHLAADALAVGAAKNTHGQFGTTRAHQAGNAHNLATLHMQVHAPDHFAVGVLLVVHTPVAHLKRGLANLGRALRVTVGHFATHHMADHHVFTGGLVATVQRRHRGTVAQNRDRIGHFGHFIEFVRNQDAGDALAFQLQQQLQQGIAVHFVQAGCGLVQNQQLDFFGQRFGNLHQLLFAHAQVGDQGAGLFVQAHFAQQRLRFDVGSRPVNDPVP